MKTMLLNIEERKTKEDDVPANSNNIKITCWGYRNRDPNDSCTLTLFENLLCTYLYIVNGLYSETCLVILYRWGSFSTWSIKILIFREQFHATSKISQPEFTKLHLFIVLFSFFLSVFTGSLWLFPSPYFLSFTWVLKAAS